MIKNYFTLTKPGIIMGNVITAAAGFLMASKGHINFQLFILSLLGITLGLAASTVLNNYIDRGIDSKMERTKNRPSATGAISGRNVLILFFILASTGGLLLLIFTNLLTVGLSVVGFFFYIVLYSIMKRRSIYGTQFGSISGAVPPVVGYTSVTHVFDMGALILFLLLVFWQMPHFFAIGIFRREDYAKAGIAALPVKKGARTTKFHILAYVAAFILTVPLLTVFSYTGYLYLILMLIISISWLIIGIKGFKIKDEIKWARKMFGFSLLVLLSLSLLISIDYTPINSQLELCSNTCLLK